MKLFYFIIISFCVFSHGVKSQTPTWQWAKGAGGNNYDISSDITVDKEGNIIATGNFRSPTITFGATVLNNNGSADVFIVKYDPLGNVIWAKSAGGTNSDGSSSIAISPLGNILITGTFYSDTIVFGNTMLINSGVSSIFIVEYDTAGNVIWAREAGGNSLNIGSDICVDVSGNILLTGYFSSNILYFGSTALTNSTFAGFEIFIIKLDSTGNLIWARTSSGTDSAQMGSIATDQQGNVIVTGVYLSSIGFGTISLMNVSLDNSYYDFFVAKYDSTGGLLWAKQAGGVYDDNCWSITCDTDNNLLLTGTFSSDTLFFGDSIITQPTTQGYTDVFVVKLDTNGSVLWTRSGSGNSDEYCFSIATDSYNNVLITGLFYSPDILFDSFLLNNSSTLPYSDIFVVKYDPSGNIIYALAAGGVIHDQGRSIVADSTGAVYLTGTFDSQVVNFGATTLSNIFYSDIFVAKLDFISGMTQFNSGTADLAFYPNPTTGIVNISSSEDMVSVSAFNSLGQILHQSNPGSKTAFIQLDEPGIYNIRISTTEGYVTKRVVVTK